FGSALMKSVTKFGSRHGDAEAFGAQRISRAPSQTETNATDRAKSVRGADREQVRYLFARTTKHRVERAVRKAAEEEQRSLELFRKTAAVVSKNDRLVDYQREERRNANGSPGKINQRVCERKAPASIAQPLLKGSAAITDPTRC